MTLGGIISNQFYFNYNPFICCPAFCIGPRSPAHAASLRCPPPANAASICYAALHAHVYMHACMYIDENIMQKLRCEL